MKPTSIATTVVTLVCAAAFHNAAHAALLGTVANGTDTTLVVIDTGSGMATPVGPIGIADVQGLAARDADVLFAATGNPLSPDTGQMVVMVPAVTSTGAAFGTPDGSPIGDLAHSPVTGVLYATCTRFSASPGKPDTLCIVNQTTGALTMADPSGMNALDPTLAVADFDGLAFGPSGTLYAATTKAGNPPGEPRLYTVNTSTGIASAVGAIRDAGNAQINAGIIGLEFVGTQLLASTDDARIITIDPATGIYDDVGPTTVGNVQGLADMANVTPPPTSTPTPPPTPTPSPINCTGTLVTNPCVPGGGSKTTDCRMEWATSVLPPPDSKGLPKRKLACYEGDPRCDFDTNVTNDSCTFRVRLCLNNSDARLSCSPSDINRFEVRSPKSGIAGVDATNLTALQNVAGQGGFGITVVSKGTTVYSGAPYATANVCSQPVDLIVPLKTGQRTNRKLFKIVGTSSTGVKDVDSLILECRKSNCGNGIIDAGESCDDGNRINGDGCNQACQIEPPTPTATNTLPPTRTPTISGPTRTPSNTPIPVNTLPPTETPTQTATPNGIVHRCTFSSVTKVTLNASKLGIGLNVALTGHQDWLVGFSDANGIRQVTALASGTHFDCVTLPLSQGALCIRGGVDSTGVMDCNGTAGTPSYNNTVQVDHNSNNGNNPGFDPDPTCSASFTEPWGQVSSALLEDGSTQHPHTGVCNSPTEIVESGTFPAGGLKLAENLTIRLIPASVTTSCTPNPCPPDNAPFDVSAGDINGSASASTGTSASTVFDVNNTTTAFPKSVTGSVFGCANIDANNLSAGKIVGSFAVLDLSPSVTGDVVATLTLGCQ